MMPNERFERAIAAIDAANEQDPNTEAFEGREYPKELLYSMRMSAWLEKLRPDAPEALRLAARAQHIQRWTSPRGSYPEGRTGYLKWRKDLYKFHADTAARILNEAGYDAETVARVAFLLRKKRLRTDPDTQSLEDAACLVFLEFHIADFVRKTEDDKMVGVLRKTWTKMSEAGRSHALALDYPKKVRSLLEAALEEPKS